MVIEPRKLEGSPNRLPLRISISNKVPPISTGAMLFRESATSSISTVPVSSTLKGFSPCVRSTIVSVFHREPEPVSVSNGFPSSGTENGESPPGPSGSRFTNVLAESVSKKSKPGRITAANAISPARNVSPIHQGTNLCQRCA